MWDKRETQQTMKNSLILQTKVSAENKRRESGGKNTGNWEEENVMKFSYQLRIT